MFPGQETKSLVKIFQGLPLWCVNLLPPVAMHLLCHLACIVIVHCMLYMGSERMAYSLASGDCFVVSYVCREYCVVCCVYELCVCLCNVV
jgi:hypothetical protein